MDLKRSAEETATLSQNSINRLISVMDVDLFRYRTVLNLISG
jgi:hypothetical protein